MWDDKDFRRDIAERHIDVWEEYSPGFRKNLIDYWMSTPLDHARNNPNLYKGCMISGGAAVPSMMYGNFPGADGFGLGGIVTPIKSLYLATAGIVASGSGTGYKTAVFLAEKLGIRKQPWWRHKIMEYVTKKYVDKTYVPLKPASILDK